MFPKELQVTSYMIEIEMPQEQVIAICRDDIVPVPGITFRNDK